MNGKRGGRMLNDNPMQVESPANKMGTKRFQLSHYVEAALVNRCR